MYFATLPGSEATNLLVGLAVHGDDLYISDATTRWTVSENVNNFLEARGDGRILRYNLKNKKVCIGRNYLALNLAASICV